MPSSISSSAPRRRSSRRSDVAPGPDPGHGRLGRADVPGAPGGDPGLALDLEPVQRPMGDPLPRDRRSGTTSDTPCPWSSLVLAAGLIGYARLAAWLLPRRSGPGLAGLGLARAPPRSAASDLRDVTRRMDRVPAAIDRQEAEEIWSWIRQVGPDDAVMADSEVSAPLSSRRLALRLYPRRQPAAGISPPRPGVPLALRPERLPMAQSLAGSGVRCRPPRALPDDRPPRDDQLGRKFGNFPISREHKSAIRCLCCVPLLNWSRFDPAPIGGRSFSSTDLAAVRIAKGRPGVLPGRIEVSGA